MEERIITAVFVVGFLKFYDLSLTAYKVSEKPNNPGGCWSCWCVTLRMCTVNINSGEIFKKGIIVGLLACLFHHFQIAVHSAGWLAKGKHNFQITFSSPLGQMKLGK